MTKTKHKILSVFLSFCMIISCMVGMSVTAGAVESPSVSKATSDLSGTGDITIDNFYKDFDEVTEEEAKAWTGASTTGYSVLYYKIDGTTLYRVVFNKGTYDSTVGYGMTISNWNMTYGSNDVYYTTGSGSSSTTYTVTLIGGTNATRSGGEATQSGLSGAMTDVVYTANDGYYFPEDYAVTAVNGISVTRNSYTQITVSGIPTADAAITLTAPTAKTTPAAPTTAAATDCTTAENNDGKLTGVTAAMEYKNSDAENWTAGTGSDITGLVPGTYYVRIKATDTANASGYQELTIAGYTAQTYTVTLTGGANATLSGGDSTQSGLSGAMSTVTYTANSGYHFAEFTAITTTGITMTRTSDTVITISGTPTADTNITVPDAVADSASITYTLVPAKPATCTATGNKEYYTGSDGKLYAKNDDTYTETTLDAVTIAKTAHTLTAVAAVDAKCTTDGTKAHYKCSVCEKLFEDADGKTETTADALKVAALGHNYVGGTCTRCGATEPYNGGHYAPYIPSGSTTTTTTITNTGSFADETKENTNYSGAKINMKSDELEKAILTDEDKKVIAAGGNVTVELEVEEKTPTAEEKKEVEAAVEAAKEASGEDYTVAMYFDANLFKTSNGTKTQIHETNGKIAVSFKLPAQFKNTDSSVTRTYAVARIHDGKTEILVCEYDPETDLLTFYTDKFSTYALMYEDAKADDADVSAVDDDDEQGDEGAVDDEQFDETDDEALEDDTDDDFAEDKTDGGTDDDVQAAVDAAVDNGETNPNTGVPLAGMGVFAVMSLFASAAACTCKKRK